jgi:hypothetical protein
LFLGQESLDLESLVRRQGEGQSQVHTLVCGRGVKGEHTYLWGKATDYILLTLRVAQPTMKKLINKRARLRV